MTSHTTAWDDAGRWDRAHLLLSMDAAVPLYRYLGLPFAADDDVRFQAVVQQHVHAGAAGAEGVPGPSLAQRQGALLVALDNHFGSLLRRAYFDWYQAVWVDRAGEHGRGIARWQTIFMRCAVRAGWWDRLHLPPAHNDAVASDLLSCRIEREEAEQLTQAFDPDDVSEWDRWAWGQLGGDAEALANGEPFNRLILTVNYHHFRTFWDALLRRLNPSELDQLWLRGQEIAPSLQLNPAEVEHPARLAMD